MVECQLPKLNTRVRFPSPAPSKNPPEAFEIQWFQGDSFQCPVFSDLHFIRFFAVLVVEKVVEKHFYFTD
jgi:hypothetical protein